MMTTRFPHDLERRSLRCGVYSPSAPPCGRRRAILRTPLLPEMRGLAPTTNFNRRLCKLQRLLQPARRALLAELVSEPETLLIVDSALLRQLVRYPEHRAFALGDK